MSASYAVFSYTDTTHGIEIPVGVALWSPERQFADVRLVGSDESLEKFKQRDAPYVDLVHEKVRHWMKSGHLPHCDAHLEPWDNAWWTHVRELLIHRTKISEPRPIESSNPAKDLDTIYEMVTAKARPVRERATRVDGAITRCLNDLSQKFVARKAVPGYHGRSVTVTRAYEGRHATVIIEGVSLAADPDAASDLAVGKLLRIRNSERTYKVIVGYLTSPGGLNGERVLVDFLREATGAKAFDLMNERSELYNEAEAMMLSADDQSRLRLFREG